MAALAAALVLTGLAGLGAVARVAGASRASAAPRPQADGFYRPPAGWSRRAPGTILRSRHVTLAAFSALPQRIAAWQLLYRSTSATGRPMAAVTTVLLPAGGHPRALLSYQLAEDASAPQCAPSYTLRQGDAPGEIVNQAEIVFVDAAVADGLAVSVPDYEGPRGEFGAPRQPGYVILDGLRAAERFGSLGLPGARTPTAIWGYSGGSLATGWAAQVQPRYAPSLALRGAAVGGFVTNLRGPVLAVNGGIASGLIASTLPGLLKGDPALARLIVPHLTAAGRALTAHAGSQCEIANLAEYPFTNFDRYADQPIARLLGSPAVARAIGALSLGGVTPKVPLYVYHGVHDELVPIAGPDATVARYCARGAAVTYTRDLLSDHGSLTVTGGPAALAWLRARLSGARAPRGCTATTVPSISFSAASLAGFPAFLRGDLLGLLGAPVGG